MPPSNSFYSKTTLWGRLVRSLTAAVVTTLLFVVIAFVNGWFVSSDASSESLVFWTGLCAAILALTFVATIAMFEFWWRRHPPAWMITQDDDGIDVTAPEHRD